jgi:hypothetical protein
LSNTLDSLQVFKHVAKGGIKTELGDKHEKHLPRDGVSYVTAWQFDVINGELAVPTVFGT